MSVQEILSIQLYTLRALGSLDTILNVVADAGYRHVEMIGAHLADPDGTRAALLAHGLECPSSHVGLDQLRNDQNAVIAACQTLGIGELYMPAVSTEDRNMAAGGWRALGRELGRMAEEFADKSIKLGYHNHDWELTKKDGEMNALDLLFEAAGSSPLAWQADLAWLARGGADPKIFLAKYQSRVAAIHVKDIAPKGRNLDQDGWADVGSGMLDWPNLWRTARAAGGSWMVVEHDKPADPKAFARNAFKFLTSMTV